MDGFDAPDETEAPVFSEHDAQLGVEGLDPVVRPRDVMMIVFWSEELEEGSFAYSPVEHVAGAHEALVGLLDGPVRIRAGLGQPLMPPGFPGGIVMEPVNGPFLGGGVQEAVGQVEQLFARLELGMTGGQYGYVHEHVEQAALHPGPRPGLAHGLANPRTSITDQDPGRADPAEQGAPRPGGLGPGGVPAQHHAGLVHGDEHDRVAAQMDAVGMDPLMGFVDERGLGPVVPIAGGMVPECSRGQAQLALGALGEQPGEEFLETGFFLSAGENPRAAAFMVGAPPPGGAFERGSVAFHPPTAPGA